MRKLVIVFLTMALLAVLSAIPVHAQVQLPHAFFGTVEIDDSDALDGTEVRASVDTGSIIAVQNPVTTVGGSYGINSPRLLVQGDIPEGAIITFHVTNADGTAIADVTAIFEAGGGPDERNLSVTIAVPPAPAGGVGGGGVAAMYIETNLFGVASDFRIDRETGEIKKTIEAISEDGNLTLTIPKGTIALDKDGDPLESLEAAIDETPPDPPVNAHIIGLTYDFGPDGATFDPPITLTWVYDPDALPEGVAEEDLVLAYYDEDADEWVELECEVDTENNIITASVGHFTTFALIGSVTPPEEEEVAPPEEEEVAPPVEVPAEPAAFTTSSLSISPTAADIGQSVTISVLVANTGDVTGSYEVTLKINNVAVATQDVTLAGGASQTVTFTIAKDAAGTYTVNIDGLSGTFVVKAPPVEVPAPINWPLIGGIIAAVVVVALLIYFLVVRRRAA